MRCAARRAPGSTSRRCYGDCVPVDRRGRRRGASVPPRVGPGRGHQVAGEPARRGLRRHHRAPQRPGAGGVSLLSTAFSRWRWARSLLHKSNAAAASSLIDLCASRRLARVRPRGTAAHLRVDVDACACSAADARAPRRRRAAVSEARPPANAPYCAAGEAALAAFLRAAPKIVARESRAGLLRGRLRGAVRDLLGRALAMSARVS